MTFLFSFPSFSLPTSFSLSLFSLLPQPPKTHNQNSKSKFKIKKKKACRLGVELKEAHDDAFNVHRRKVLVHELAPVLRQCSLLAASTLAGLYDDEGSGGSGVKKTGLRPVRPWPEGVVNISAEDGSFTASCKCNSEIDVRHLIWRYLEGSATNRTEEDIELKSPRVRESIDCIIPCYCISQLIYDTRI